MLDIKTLQSVSAEITNALQQNIQFFLSIKNSICKAELYEWFIKDIINAKIFPEYLIHDFEISNYILNKSLIYVNFMDQNTAEITCYYRICFEKPLLDIENIGVKNGNQRT